LKEREEGRGRGREGEEREREREREREGERERLYSKSFKIQLVTMFQVAHKQNEIMYRGILTLNILLQDIIL